MNPSKIKSAIKRVKSDHSLTSFCAFHVIFAGVVQQFRSVASCNTPLSIALKLAGWKAPGYYSYMVTEETTGERRPTRIKTELFYKFQGFDALSGARGKRRTSLPSLCTLTSLDCTVSHHFRNFFDRVA
ncbi:hypothetical protein CBL_11402 [Carabus blaptoides fortunei]